MKMKWDGIRNIQIANRELNRTTVLLLLKEKGSAPPSSTDFTSPGMLLNAVPSPRIISLNALNLVVRPGRRCSRLNSWLVFSRSYDGVQTDFLAQMDPSRVPPEPASR